MIVLPAHIRFPVRLFSHLKDGLRWIICAYGDDIGDKIVLLKHQLVIVLFPIEEEEKRTASMISENSFPWLS